MSSEAKKAIGAAAERFADTSIGMALCSRQEAFQKGADYGYRLGRAEALLEACRALNPNGPLINKALKEFEAELAAILKEGEP